MNFKKVMQQKGPAMVNAAAKEVSADRANSDVPIHPMAVAPEKAAQLIKAIETNKKLTTEVPIAKILLDENVRTLTGTESIRELGESLKDVGLIHSILLHLVERDGNFFFVCVSGKRRVLAAESIGMEKIEAEITLGTDQVESLYVGAIANLHEQVFWLDNANLYSKLCQQGHSDERIASRLKVNSRTVGWFRRLAEMSPSCQNLSRMHSELFNSRWAQQVARHGDLPSPRTLEEQMIKMISIKRTWHVFSDNQPERAGASAVDKSEAVVAAHRVAKDFKPDQVTQTKAFLTSLAQAGFMTKAAYKRIQSEFFKETPASLEMNFEQDGLTEA